MFNKDLAQGARIITATTTTTTTTTTMDKLRSPTLGYTNSISISNLPNEWTKSFLRSYKALEKLTGMRAHITALFLNMRVAENIYGIADESCGGSLDTARERLFYTIHPEFHGRRATDDKIVKAARRKFSAEILEATRLY